MKKLDTKSFAFELEEIRKALESNEGVKEKSIIKSVSKPRLEPKVEEHIEMVD